MKVGIIGAGKISEKHILAYRALGHDDMVIHDLDGNLSREAASRFNIAHIEDQDALISSCDIVDVCTPVTTHKTIIQKALKKGRHVFCEKPLCQSIEEALEIKSCAEEAGKLVMVGYLYRFHPGFQQVKKWLNANLLGPVHFGLFRIGGRGNHKKWKHIKATGGGCVNEMLLHKLDLVNFFLGNIDEVKPLFRETLLKSRDIDGETFEPDAEDNIVLQLRAGKAEIICQADFTTPSYMEYLELHGAYGSIFTSILGFFPTILFLKKPSGIYNQGNNQINFNQVNLFELELDHFFASIRSGQMNMNSVDDSIELMKIVEKIEEGA